ncbi:hypothetical protein MSG28_003574 [Choristoneura fumiferana]|uniref:Uncharacterized protein n=1 Tax=Choristoneura fumiferana TaxID=7141 RepID=A0ACC0KG04_CHOFU|nr:hypothetical protein MSG28_003574 [Choristoneura fumiferana]
MTVDVMFVSVNVKEDDYPELKWPKKYTVEAVKLYLSAGWSENYKYWRSSKSSRIDANDGAVIKIARAPRTRKSKGDEYEIHPETTEEELNKMVCYVKHGTTFSPITPKEFLPLLVWLEPEGPDNVKGVDCVKFTNANENEAETKQTLWAVYENETEAWVPIRFEEEEVNKWHGYFSNHVIWDFFNFQPNFVKMDDIKIYKDYDCIEKNDDDDDDTIKSVAETLESLKPEDKQHLDHVFKTYKKRFNKQYAHKNEHEMRKSIFHKKWRLVEDTNRKNMGYTLALNKLSDRTDEEMKRYRGLRRNKPRSPGNVPFPYTQQKIKEIAETLPSEYDLRLEGVVGPVLNQEDCGSCWSFGATAAAEGALARSNGGNLIKLSNQALLDCSWGFGNSGCDGGNDEDSYKWMMEYGLPTEQEYGPYLMQEGFCDIENMTTTYKIRGYTDVTPFSVEALKVALINHGPLSVSIDSSDALEMYEEGIFYDPSCESSPDKLNHEVTLVGYGTKDGDTFWIIKNTRGPYWGLDGYAHISTRDNNCGVATEPTYVVF